MLPVLIAAAVAASLASDLQEIARLPGEPSIVSAAGLDANGEPVLTLENPSAFDPQSLSCLHAVWGLTGLPVNA